MYAGIFMAGIALLSSGCDGDKAAEQEPVTMKVNMKDELIPVLDSLERVYERACLNTGLANWNSYSGEGPADLDSAKEAFAGLFLDTVARNMIIEWREKSGSLADEGLARRLELWHRAFLGGAIYSNPAVATLENDLQKRIISHPLRFEGRSTTRAKVQNALRTERRQSRRRKLWSVPSQISATVAPDLVGLVRQRNELARASGFPNYYSLSLFLHALDEKWLLKTLTMLEERTRPAFREMLLEAASSLKVKETGPWDAEYLFTKTLSLPDKYFPPDSVFSVIHEFERAIGFDVDSLPIQEVVKDIPYGGLSLAITIPTDSRFLVNPTKGKGFYGVAFHEYGHSLKAVHTDVEYPILKGYEWVPGLQCAAFEEGVAEMHAEFTEDSLWLSRYTDAKPEEIARYITGRRLPALYRLRRLLKDFFFEYEMYKNPAQDLAALERSMVEKYLLTTLDESVPHQFASSIWYTSYPCYYQNYILAAMIGTQLQEAMTNIFGDEKISDRRVAEWMKTELYGDGETREWTERIRNASGKNLEPGAYLRKLGIEVSHLIHKE